MATFIYVVASSTGTKDGNAHGARTWYWDESEGRSKFYDLKDGAPSMDHMLFRVDVEEAIESLLDEHIGALSLIGTMLDSYQAPEEAAVEYTTLESRNGVLSIERSAGSDVWQYRVTNRLQNQWAVFETLSDERIGYVYFTTEDGLPTFEVSDRRTGDAEVNRDSLQAAVEYIIERDISGE